VCFFLLNRTRSRVVSPTLPGRTRGGTSSKERGGQRLKTLFASEWDWISSEIFVALESCDLEKTKTGCSCELYTPQKKQLEHMESQNWLGRRIFFTINKRCNKQHHQPPTSFCIVILYQGNLLLPTIIKSPRPVWPRCTTRWMRSNGNASWLRLGKWDGMVAYTGS